MQFRGGPITLAEYMSVRLLEASPPSMKLRAATLSQGFTISGDHSHVAMHALQGHAGPKYRAE